MRVSAEDRSVGRTMAILIAWKAPSSADISFAELLVNGVGEQYRKTCAHTRDTLLRISTQPATATPPHAKVV